MNSLARNFDNIDRVFGIKSPRKWICVVETIKAMAEGDIKVFIGLAETSLQHLTPLIHKKRLENVI